MYQIFNHIVMILSMKEVINFGDITKFDSNMHQALLSTPILKVGDLDLHLQGLDDHLQGHLHFCTEHEFCDLTNLIAFKNGVD